MTRKIVLTGGPGTGKSTTLELLKAKGYYTLGEVATWIIGIESKKQDGKLPWTDKDAFQKTVLETQLEWENQIPKEVETAFLDRGLPDGLAYYRVDGLKPPRELEQAAKKAEYNKIFLIEPLSRFERTEVRRENTETARKLHQEIEKVYRELGYNPIRIPEATPEERVRLILEETRK